jgi:multiple sugar transport system permease protein
MSQAATPATAGPASPAAPPPAVAPPGAVPPARTRWLPTGNPLKVGFFLVLLLGLSVLFLYPFLWTVSASLKPREEVFDNRLIPAHWHFANYEDVWHAAPVLNWFVNSTYIAVLAAFAVTISSGIVAFAFAYFRFPLRNFFFACVLATMMLPGAVTMIPVYLIWNHLGFTHPGDFLGLPKTQYPLWAGNLFASPFYVFLLRQFFLGIPRELFEAARMDGDNYWTMFWRIAAPLAKPALIVTFVFEFVASWRDLLKPLIYLRDDHLYTIPRGLFVLLGQYGPSAGGEGDWQIIIAATVVATVPMIIIFFLGQRYFVEGIAAQGRKG